MNKRIGGAVEQRRQPRMKLVCPIRLYRDVDPVEVQTETQNISSGGFYCFSPRPFAPGEQLQCDIQLPNHKNGGTRRGPVLRCRIVIVHAVAQGARGYGLGCRIEHYEVGLE